MRRFRAHIRSAAAWASAALLIGAGAVSAAGPMTASAHGPGGDTRAAAATPASGATASSHGSALMQPLGGAQQAFGGHAPSASASNSPASGASADLLGSTQWNAHGYSYCWGLGLFCAQEAYGPQGPTTAAPGGGRPSASFQSVSPLGAWQESPRGWSSCGLLGLVCAHRDFESGGDAEPVPDGSTASQQIAGPLGGAQQNGQGSTIVQLLGSEQHAYGTGPAAANSAPGSDLEFLPQTSIGVLGPSAEAGSLGTRSPNAGGSAGLPGPSSPTPATLSPTSDRLLGLMESADGSEPAA